MNRLIKIITLMGSVTFFSLQSYAEITPAEVVVRDIQHRWAVINYAPKTDTQAVLKLDQLAADVENHAAQFPDSVEIMIWNAIVLSTLADRKGGLGALSKVKKAKSLLEQSMQIDSRALKGSAYASLGTLYHKVPGWPIGYGNKAKAREHLEKALQINPDGLDINYLYAEYLVENKDIDLAIQHLNKALVAPTLDGRPLADAGRRAQAQVLLNKISS